MVKTLVSMLIALFILIFGALYENDFVSRQFVEMRSVLQVLYEKVDSQTATQDDVYAVQNAWIEKKKVLHIFIPHNEIKEVDLWLSESATLVRDKEWSDAISKIEVLTELTEQIPKTFKLSWENLL